LPKSNIKHPQFEISNRGLEESIEKTWIRTSMFNKKLAFENMFLESETKQFPLPENLIRKRGRVQEVF